jgi:predicted nucleic acid-binding Zn ribbon protein
MSKLVSAAGFQLKGTGWYATDFKNSGAKPAKPDAAADAASESKSAETKTEAAPACGAGACPACQ